MARWFVDRSPQRGIPSVSLRRLLPEAKFVGCKDWEVSGCTSDSRRLEPGQLFVAVVGSRHDGHDYVTRALDRGAAGVVVERPCPEAGRLQVIVPDTRAALARLCHALAGEPANHLRLVGIAGSSDKTATALFLKSILEATGERWGLISPIGWSDGVATHPAGASSLTPESLSRMLGAMVENFCAGGLIQVNEDTLERRGLEGTRLQEAIVTSLNGSRLFDPHDDVIARRRSAAKLFRLIDRGGAAIVNADDEHADLLGAVNLDARRISFGMQRPAHLTAKIERLGGSGSRFQLRGFDRELTVQLRLVGSRHVRSALAAAAVAWSRGIDGDAVVAGLEALSRVPGRLEPVRQGQPFEVRVDRARTARQLRGALATMREICRGQIICVIGAEGLTERSLRLDLARAAEFGADRIILTSDNPRTEAPDQIIDDLLAGCLRPGRVRVEPDRRAAIALALESAAPGDGVLIAGKGRDAFQIFADRALPFDDHAASAEWLRSHASQARRTSA